MATTTSDLQEMHTEFEAAAGMDGAPDFVHRPSVLGSRHMISSVHYHATMGGLRILEQGGNAIDAGVAAGICLNVVEPQSAMFGGVAPIVGSGSSSPTVPTTRGRQHHRRFRPEPRVHGERPRPLAAGSLAGQLPLPLRRRSPGRGATHGDAGRSRRLAHGVGAVRHAQSGRGTPAGVGVDAGGVPHVAGATRIHRQRRATGYPLSQWPSSAAVWLPNGRVPAVGEIFRQPDLAATFQRLINAEAHASGDRAARIMAAPRSPLPGRACPADCVVLPGRGQHPHRPGPRRVRGESRAAGAHDLPRLRCLQLRTVVPRADAAPSPQPAGGLRSPGDGAWHGGPTCMRSPRRLIWPLPTASGTTAIRT